MAASKSSTAPLLAYVRSSAHLAKTERMSLSGGRTGVHPGALAVVRSPLDTASDGVGEVGGRRDPVELRQPSHPGCQRPEGGQDSIHCHVLAVTLLKSRLAGGVVNPRHPQFWQVTGKGREGYELGDDFQDVNEGSPSREVLQEADGDRPAGEEDLGPDSQHEAPSIVPSVLD